MFLVVIYIIFICLNVIMLYKKEEIYDFIFKSWKKNYDVICCLLIKKILVIGYIIIMNLNVMILY